MDTRVKPAYDTERGEAACKRRRPCGSACAKVVPERCATHNVVAGLDVTGLDPVMTHLLRKALLVMIDG
jgi:hypothetical protein